MSVDLPLPDGPHTTTTSPFFTSVEQDASTRKLPYHLLTFRISIMFSPAALSGRLRSSSAGA